MARRRFAGLWDTRRGESVVIVAYTIIKMQREAGNDDIPTQEAVAHRLQRSERWVQENWPMNRDRATSAGWHDRRHHVITPVPLLRARMQAEASAGKSAKAIAREMGVDYSKVRRLLGRK